MEIETDPLPTVAFCRERSKESQVTLNSLDPARADESNRVVCDYYIGLYEQKCERERQERIAEANPKLIAWKTEYMQDKKTPSRRAALGSQFVELYRQAYRKDVPVEVLAKEWNEIRRRAALKKLCAAATGETK